MRVRVGLVLLLGLGAASCDPESPGLVSVDAGVAPDAEVCPEPRRSCGGACVDPASDPSHCGGCFAVCGFGTKCADGACASTCGPRQTDCGGACADLEVSLAHCGACNVPCRADQVCEGGACACPEGLSDCGACVDLVSDDAHCGACGRACGEGERCVEGDCVCARATREEVCTDGEDDDCDGAIDCDDLDCLGATRPCAGACGPGVERCGIGNRWGVCEGGDGTAEVCGDGVDQDCSGADLRAPDRFEPNDDCGTCARVSGRDPRTTIRNLTFDSVEDDVDCFFFEVTDGALYREHIEAELRSVPAGHDYGLFLYRGASGCRNREVLAAARARGGNAELRWGERFFTADGGTYYLRVVRYAGQDCEESYELRINGLR